MIDKNIVIAIIFRKIDSVKRYMRELSETHQDKIAKYYRAQNKMILINGDIIKGYSVNGRLDGLSADAVVGTDNRCITFRSRLDNPIWTKRDLEKYIGEINEA